MNPAHPEQASGRWHRLSLAEQLANVGSEGGRALSWRTRDAEIGHRAAERALELMDLTIGDPSNRRPGCLRELTRAREVLADFLWGDNVYGSTAESLNRYFTAFNLAARANR